MRLSHTDELQPWQLFECSAIDPHFVGDRYVGIRQRFDHLLRRESPAVGVDDLLAQGLHMFGDGVQVQSATGLEDLTRGLMADQTG